MKRKIDSYFKPTGACSNSQPSMEAQDSVQAVEQNHPVLDEGPQPQEPEVPEPRMRSVAYERDPGKRRQIWEYPQNQRDEVRRFYINEGPYQPYLAEYPLAGSDKHRHQFQYEWFRSFNWLEYSLHTHCAYCLPCFLFATRPHGKCGSDAFIVKGFQKWRKIGGGKDCAFLIHMGQDSNSAHNFAIQCYENLRHNLGHIENVIEKQSEKVVLDARLRFKVSIDSVKWLTFQACAFRGHDESPESRNQGNFLQMIKLLASYSKEVNAVVLENAPRNAKYTSPTVQKEILHIFARKVQTTIRDEIGNGKFCIIVDESRDESKKEQMAIVVRFVDKEGFIKERFLDLVHVRNTTALTLKESICAVLSDNNLSVQDIRGQGYDGVICEGSGMDYKLLYLRSALMHIMCIAWRTGYN